MLAFILPFLLSTIVLTSGQECTSGPGDLNNFDMEKYTGKWYWLYHTENPAEKNIANLVDDFAPLKDGKSEVSTSYYDLGTNTDQVDKGVVDAFDGSSIHISYGADSRYGTTYYVLVVEYDKYIVTRGCLADNKEPSLLVGFRDEAPDQEVIDEALEKAKKSATGELIPYGTKP